MRDLEIYRRDFRDSEDGSHTSLFEWILRQLGIPEKKWDDIDEVKIKDIVVDDVEIS